MATFFSGTQVGTWSGYAMCGTLTGDVSRSGNTVTLSSLRCTFTAAGAWGTDSGYWCAIYSGDAELSRNTALVMNSGSGSMDLPNCGVTVSDSATSHTFNFRTSDGYRVNFTVSFSANVTAPTGLSLSNIVPSSESITATVSVSGWGGTGDASTRYRELSICADRSISTRKFNLIYGNTMSSTITVSNEVGQAGTLTLVPNTRYYATMYATNGTYHTGNTAFTEVATLAKAPTINLESTNGDSATFSYSTEADGGFYDKNIEYSLDGGETWTTALTITGGSATSGTFTVEGLTSGNTYDIKVRAKTTSGSSESPTIVFVAGGEVNGVGADGKQIVGILGSVDGVATSIVGILGSINKKAVRA